MFDEPTFSQAPEAITFVQHISTNTGRKATLGDPDKYEPNPDNHVAAAHEAIKYGLEKVQALAKDRTRMPVQKHEKARDVANWVCEQLEQSRVGIENSIRQINKSVETAILKKLDTGRLSDRTQDRICKWIERAYREEDGAAKVRSMVEANLDVAAVLFFEKPFLLGMSEEFHSRMVTAAWRAHVPDAQAAIDKAAELRGWADNYPQLQRSIRASWYSKALADQAATRVEI